MDEKGKKSASALRDITTSDWVVELISAERNVSYQRKKLFTTFFRRQKTSSKAIRL